MSDKDKNTKEKTVKVKDVAILAKTFVTIKGCPRLENQLITQNGGNRRATIAEFEKLYKKMRG